MVLFSIDYMTDDILLSISTLCVNCHRNFPLIGMGYFTNNYIEKSQQSDSEKTLNLIIKMEVMYWSSISALKYIKVRLD